jgi:dihydroxyacid dehydratase/phosphogluconate dehydratase
MNSDAVKKGVDRAPHRSLFKALGLTDREIDRPLVGIVNSFNELVPGHMHLRNIAEAVKAGVGKTAVHRWSFPQSVSVTVLPWDMSACIFFSQPRVDC